MSQLKEWPECQRPGVYFLFERSSGADEDNIAYTGESEDVFKRLVNHDKDKDFWTEVILLKGMPMSSPSYAASIVSSNSRNGLISWKAVEGENVGKTLKEIEQLVLAGV